MALTSIAGDAGETSKTHNLGPATWVVVLIGIFATVAFSLVVLDSGEGTVSVPGEVNPTVTLLNPHASDAIERRALAELERERAATRVFDERGSVTALDHEAANADDDGGVPPNVR